METSKFRLSFYKKHSRVHRKNCDQEHVNAIAEKTENYYRNHNYALAYAKVSSFQESTGTVTIKIGVPADYNERSIDAMKRRSIQEGSHQSDFFRRE